MKKNFNVIIRAVFTVVIIYFLFNVVRVIYDVNQVEKEAEEISKELETVEERVSKLKYRYDLPVDESYLEKIARENGYYFPDEIIFYNNFAK